jgi:NAD(P)-dependent dehydrogenase (short-subunit alcohol dehydrogenase family)
METCTMRDDDTPDGAIRKSVGRLDGKAALITGAAGGIGRIAAELFANEGASVVIADVTEGEGKAAVDVIRDAGGHAAFVKADVSDAADAEAMVRFAVETFGGLHVLYNNAGILPSDDAGTLDTPEATWERVMAVNLKGVWLGCKYGIPALLDSGGGSIVNVSSLVALMGSAVPQIAYTASKGGVLAMTREIAVEYARRGIRANVLCPGPIETPLMAELMADPQWSARRLVHIPMGRPGQADEVARAALFLACDDSSFMTGATLVVDGGITAAYVTPE